MDEVYEVCSEGIAIVLDVYLRVNHFYLLFFFFKLWTNGMMFVLYMCDVCHLFTFAVDAFRSEQIDGLLYQVRAATAEHAEPQVLQKLCLSGCSI